MQIAVEPEVDMKRNNHSNPLEDKLFALLVKETLAQWSIPGIAIGVVDGEREWHKGYGLRDISNEEHVTTDTLFYAGSTTKAFTAAALAKLVSDPAYPAIESWRTPVCSIIRDDFVVGDAWTTARLTLEEILTHRTGMPVHDQAHGRAPSKETPRDAPRPAVREITRQLRHLPLTAEPRTAWQYCNIMYIAASHVIETVTGQWLGKFVHENIFRPLQMHGTYFATEDALSAPQPLAKGYRYETESHSYVEIPPMDLDGTSGAGSVLSNVVDFTKWARAVLTRADILDAAQWQELLAPRSIVDAGQPPFTGPSTYALGWRVSIYRGHSMLHHTGAMHAYGALFVLLPDLNYALVAFANTAGSSVSAAYTVLWRLLDDRLGVPPAERFDWDHKNETALQSGIASALAARSRLYPHAPSPPLPLSCPLAAYAGTYFDSGYQSLTIYVTHKPPSAFLRRFVRASEPHGQWLVADRAHVTWPERLTLEHVSADHFVAWAEHEGDYGAWYPEAYPVTFRIDVDGAVAALDIGWEAKMQEDRIHMQRIEGGE